MKISIPLQAVASNHRFHNWVRPDTAKLLQEYHVEFVLKGLSRLYGEAFVTPLDFVRAVEHAHVEEIDESKDRHISNRSRTRDMASLRSLVSSYRSWPEFRNDDTLKAIVDGFDDNLPMEMPIVIEHNGSRRIFSGNTRMDIAFQKGINPHVIIVEV